MTRRLGRGGEESPVKSVDALMKEFEADPDAYMERRASVLRDGGYEQARQRVVAEQNEALRAAGWSLLNKVLRPLSRNDGENNARTA